MLFIPRNRKKGNTMTSNFKGKRKRPNTEVDSDTESVGSNFQGHNTLSNMLKLEFEILCELIKCRFRNSPYENFRGWNDRELWNEFMCNLKYRGFVLSSEAIRHAIIDLEKIFIDGFSRHPRYEQYRFYFSAVFGPEHDNGPLVTHELQKSFLPSTSTVTLVSELSSSDGDEDCVGWKETKLMFIEGEGIVQVDLTEEESLKKQKEYTESRAEEKRNKKKGKRKKVMEYTVSSPRYNPPDPSNAPRGRFLMRSNVNYVDQTGLVDLYSEDTQQFDGTEVGRLLYNISPSSSEYQTMARLPTEKRRDAFYEFQRLSKMAPVQQRSNPYFPIHNQHYDNV